MQKIPADILDAIESARLSPIPQVLLRFLRLVEDDHASMNQLGEMVGQDPALSARVLTVANSAAFRQIKEIKNLEQCMVTLGTRLARTIAACLAVQRVFEKTSAELYDFSGFWLHSLWVAEMSREIATRIAYCDAEEAYLAGLLHDVGQLLLLDGVGENYQSMLNLSGNESVLLANENSLIGTDHAKVGAWLVDRWQLSSFMADAVLFHHKPATEIAVADPLSKVVWCAHAIAEQVPASEKLTPEAFTLQAMLGIGPQAAAEIWESSLVEVTTLSEALGIMANSDARTLPCPVKDHLERRHAQASGADVGLSGLDSAVRDMAMLQPLQQNLSALASEDEIFLAVRESARILFGLGRLAFLLPGEGKEFLSGAGLPGQPALLQRLEIHLSPPQSLAAAAALGVQARATFEEGSGGAVSLVDLQISRILESEGLLYVPLRAQGRQLGVMAYGLSRAQFATAKKQLEWITRFAQTAALSLETWRGMRARDLAMEERITASLEERSRKLAHEAGNPLGIIQNYLKVMKQRLPEQSFVGEEMEILQEEVARVSQILRRFTSSDEGPVLAASLDVNLVIEGLLALYGESLFAGCGVVLGKSLQPGLSHAAADRDSVKQILLNLWKNASEALPSGSTLHVATRDQIERNGLPHVEISVRDSGPGLPPDVRARLFQPLPPDRRPGHSGLGLSIVAELVERLGGEITCRSGADSGTSFCILLPQAARTSK